jgi:hypothetical protein
MKRLLSLFIFSSVAHCQFMMLPFYQQGMWVINTTQAQTTNNATVTTPPMSTKGADLYVATVAATNGCSVTPNISDSLGNTYTLVVNQPAGTPGAWMYCSPKPLTGTAVTFTANLASGCRPAVALIAYNGSGATAGNCQVENSAASGTAGGTATNTGTLTTHGGNAVVAVVGADTNNCCTGTFTVFDFVSGLQVQPVTISLPSVSSPIADGLGVLTWIYPVSTTTLQYQFRWPMATQASGLIATFKSFQVF